MKTTILSLVLLLGSTITRAEDGAGNHSSNRKTASPAVRNILSTQLPARLLTPIKTKYKTYWITDLHKAVSDGKVCYYVTLENADQQLKLNTNHSAKWQVSSVLPKEIASR